MSFLPKILGGIVVGMAFLVVAASLMFMRTEGLDPIQALYFAVVTVTTVGYGDIHPKTSLGMILSIIMIMGGVGIFTGTIGLISNLIITARDREAAKAKVQLLSEIFFRSVGLGLLERFTRSNPQAERLQAHLSSVASWSEEEISRARKNLPKGYFITDPATIDASEWRQFLESQSHMFQLLLGNPAISEGLPLISVLRRTYHLSLALESPQDLPTLDRAHLREQLECIYYDMTVLWLDYLTDVTRQSPEYRLGLASLNPFKDSRK